ncbi:hypothetical protein CKM354_000658100 [Cercospora kikuchii]|uniref:Uncharacterized protein n=1 Tax=Cercospora kikuchii TaxID=84275 RepID=A0A9P3FHY7_9PEZI|nr:uncharacterized protein CKM354_000658100 [Cercospora kikuchii]GIZ43349.1 hypothetical protein CKM354_000658100 [Cercospora kikuchii]
MVQIVTFRRASAPDLSGTIEDNFWKLVRREDLLRPDIMTLLRAARLPVKFSATKEELLQQHICWQRRQLDYGRCTVAELRTFSVQRGIVDSRVARKLRSKELVSKLHEADDGETFNRFLDLPAELRLYIYELYFESFETQERPLPAPYPIPLAHVSSLLRKEVLPVYYDVCTFEYNVFCIGFYLPWGSSRTRDRPPMLDFIIKGPAEHVAMLRKVNMDLRIEGGCDHDDDRTNSFIVFRIDFGTDHKRAELYLDYQASIEEGEGEFDLVSTSIRDILSAIDTRPSGKKVLKSDLQAILAIFQDPPDILRRQPTPNDSDDEVEDAEDDEESEDDGE